jgi:hypothetical protein
MLITLLTNQKILKFLSSTLLNGNLESSAISLNSISNSDGYINICIGSNSALSSYKYDWIKVGLDEHVITGNESMDQCRTEEFKWIYYISGDAVHSMWVSSILSVSGVTSQMYNSLLKCTFVMTNDNGGVERFKASQLNSVSVDTKISNWDAPVVVVVKKTYSIDSFIGKDNDFIDEGTDVFRIVVCAQS